MFAFIFRRQHKALKAWQALRIFLADKGPMTFSMHGRLGSKEADALWQRACSLSDEALGKGTTR